MKHGGADVPRLKRFSPSLGPISILDNRLRTGTTFSTWVRRAIEDVFAVTVHQARAILSAADLTVSR